MRLDLNSWEAKFVLEVLHTRDARWNAAIDAMDDEYIQSEYGNDLAQLQLCMSGLRRLPARSSGRGGREFSRVALGVTPKG